ncbi:MAG: hypothetical protein BAA02_09385 [Paenibacillaceae bacterium ZCTH02-B3]|nr:MAG: hypothetical protein BAA02_09385 [Paenibacillaceae bacterium ZCTH02-B3]
MSVAIFTGQLRANGRGIVQDVPEDRGASDAGGFADADAMSESRPVAIIATAVGSPAALLTLRRPFASILI